MFWNGLIKFCNQNYLVIAVVSFIESNNLRLNSKYTITEIYCSILAICGMVFAVIFPIVILYFYYQAVKPSNVKFSNKELEENMQKFNLTY